MPKRSKRTPLLFPLLGVWAVVQAQTAVKPLGTVSTTDARVSGQVEVRGGQAQLLSNVSVTAFDRTAPVALGRGGAVEVCSTSEFHLLRAANGPSGGTAALVFGLDRGAVELRSPTQNGDIIITPDLKFSPVTQGSYDLRLRVTREGDTCVDNAGSAAPVLNVTDAFSSASYRILPGQHLLFAGGDLHRVVDREKSPCGCPAAASTVAGAGGTAAAAHPFPEAESAGLAPTTTPANAAPVGEASSQASASFSYNNGEGTPPPVPAAVPATGAGGSTGSNEATEAPKSDGFGAAVRRFFHKLFHPHSA